MQVYEPIDTRAGKPDGAFAAAWSSQMRLGARSHMLAAFGSTVARLTSARISDGTLPYSVDPSTTQTAFWVTRGSLSVTHEADARWQLRLMTGAVVNATVDSTPLPVQGNVPRSSLNTRGLNGAQPFVTAGATRALDETTSVEFRGSYHLLYAPYSLDFSTSPPTTGGPRVAHQVVPDVGLQHAFSPTLSSLTRVGLSFASPAPFDTNRDVVILPVGSEELRYRTERWTAIGMTTFSYGAVTPHLGSGPVFGVHGTWIGSPFDSGALSKVVVVGGAVAARSSLSATGGGSTELLALGCGLQARYPLTSSLGVLAGYDVHSSMLKPPEGPASGPTITYVRQIVFFGISGYWTTHGMIPPLQSFAASTRPG